MVEAATQRVPATQPTGLLARLRTDGSPIDYWLLLAVGCAMALGLVMVTSASTSISTSSFGSPFHYALRQGIYMMAGITLIIVLQTLPVRFWKEISWVLLVVACLLLVLVLTQLGLKINGSRRWISLGFFNLQASEVAKVFIVLSMATYISRHLEQLRGADWQVFLLPVGIVGGTAWLLLWEPDFGSAAVLTCTVLGMIFLAGVRWGKFLVLLGPVIAAGCVLVLEPYRLKRLTSYMDPWADQFGDSYQLTQSLIGFGRGSWFGEGLGNGIQKLFFLPEAHTDFIFSVVAEELGLIGALLVIALLFFIAWRALQIGQRAEQQGQIHAAFMAYGLGLLLGIQVCVNLGVSSGLLPTKGLALPFFSYGGSSLLMNCMAVGLLLRIDFERRASLTSKTGGREANGR